MNINGIKEINIFDYLSNNSHLDFKRLVIKMIFKDKRLVEAIRWRLAYAYLGGEYHYGNDLKLVLQDMHIDSLIRVIYLSVYDYHKFYKVVISKSKEQPTVQYLQKEYELYVEKMCPTFKDM